VAAKPASIVARDLSSRARGLLLHVGRLEAAYNAGHLGVHDVERAHGGALLYFFAYAEHSIGRLFFGLLVGQLTARSARPTISVRSYAVAAKIVAGGRPHVAWLPYQRTLERADRYFVGGRPFSSLTEPEKDSLHRLTVTRNALAHESGPARTKFYASCVAGRGIAPSQARAVAYLRGHHSASQTRLDFMMSDVVALLHRLCA